MSRYLEEAAAILRKQDKANSFNHQSTAMQIAQGFTMLAAVDKGLLPTELLADIVDQLRTQGRG
ncbi:hypothetical protein [Streptomyces sp. NPDC094049]|uniref:hypothetical protein n=1 Tax=Streptomyces sp. NPDC094049 TaxID=3154987 RepID=UPI00331BDB0C